MKYIDKEYKDEYEAIGYSKEEVLKKFCPSDKAILGDIPCRENVDKEHCLECWNRKVK